jgi:hypothetical protein
MASNSDHIRESSLGRPEVPRPDDEYDAGAEN